MPNAFLYVVDRDFGFAPNPFHGSCTLATCKPVLRRCARVGDWVFGLGGKRLRAKGRCVYAMRVDEKTTFEQYWANPRYRDKKPVRNGSAVRMVGDNIYHRDPATLGWRQADSHHSHEDGTPNPRNVRTDTSCEHVLLSRHFYYFGRDALAVPEPFLTALGYHNGRGYRVFDLHRCGHLLGWLEGQGRDAFNQVQADPFDFDQSEARYPGPPPPRVRLPVALSLPVMGGLHRLQPILPGMM